MDAHVCDELRREPAVNKTLRELLAEYVRVVEASQLAANSKNTYLLHAENFVRCTEGKFEPGGQKASNPKPRQ